MALSPASARVLAALRAHPEGCVDVIDGVEWVDVYLDNARLSDISDHVFAGHLSALEQAGLYRPLGHGFGCVCKEDPQ